MNKEKIADYIKEIINYLKKNKDIYTASVISGVWIILKKDCR